mmetsp:Transcript_107142/g.301555  ORF Transcript_107142/g.301555 Transcript_107142/m.301555 type:complete len:239 (-) Transcript_107142:927-1643(-)
MSRLFSGTQLCRLPVTPPRLWCRLRFCSCLRLRRLSLLSPLGVLPLDPPLVFRVGLLLHISRLLRLQVGLPDRIDACGLRLDTLGASRENRLHGCHRERAAAYDGHVRGVHDGNRRVCPTFPAGTSHRDLAAFTVLNAQEALHGHHGVGHLGRLRVVDGQREEVPQRVATNNDYWQLGLPVDDDDRSRNEGRRHVTRPQAAQCLAVVSFFQVRCELSQMFGSEVVLPLNTSCDALHKI